MSPALIASNAVLPSTLSILPAIFHIALSLSSSIAFFVAVMSAVAELYASKQPFLPQLHCLPLYSITTCPSSAPQKLKPVYILPPIIIPPPTPVPSVITTTSLYPFAAPPRTSPYAATLASFSTYISVPRRCFKSPPRSVLLNPRLQE